MTKKELAKAVANKAKEQGIKVSDKEAKAVIEIITSTIIDEVAVGGEVELTGFGKFYSMTTGGRVTRNPKTGEVHEVAKTKTPKFKPSTAFKGFVKALNR